MNTWSGIGRLTADPVTRRSQNGNAVAKYTLAVDRRFKKDGEPAADFIPCVVFGKGAEFAEKYLRKGTKIAVTGEIQTGSYERDGEKKYTWNVIVREHDFCERKQAEPAEEAPDEFLEVPEGLDEDVPFV